MAVLDNELIFADDTDIADKTTSATYEEFGSEVSLSEAGDSAAGGNLYVVWRTNEAWAGAADANSTVTFFVHCGDSAITAAAGNVVASSKAYVFDDGTDITGTSVGLGAGDLIVIALPSEGLYGDSLQLSYSITDQNVGDVYNMTAYLTTEPPQNNYYAGNYGS
jgi:hypothetical protein